MTMQEFIDKQKIALQELNGDRVMGMAVADTHAKMMERIFEQGKNASGGDIGTYGGGELYVNPNDSPKKFPTIGKTGKAKFDDGTSHKTGYFENYAAFRSKIGRPTNKVNLVLSGVLQSDLSNGLVKLDNSQYVVKVKNKHNIDKINGAEDKYGEVFSLSESEVKNFVDVYNYEYLELLKK